MQSLGNLEIFVRVAQEGSFTAAAEVLNLSPSAASRAIARLEKSLEVKLFHRTTRSLSLTPEGLKLKVGAESLLSDWREIEDDLASVRSSPKGLLKISAPSALGRNLLVPKLVEYQREFSQVKLEVSLDDRMVDLASDGFDVVVRTGELADSASHIARKFFDFEVYLCASPDYLRNGPSLKSHSELKGHNCLRFRNRSTGRLFPWPAALETHLPREQLVFDDGPAIAQATVLGAGLSMLPSWLSAPLIREGKLTIVDLEYHYPAQPVWLVYLNRRYVSTRIQSFVDYMAEQRPEIVESLSATNF